MGRFYSITTRETLRAGSLPPGGRHYRAGIARGMEVMGVTPLQCVLRAVTIRTVERPPRPATGRPAVG